MIKMPEDEPLAPATVRCLVQYILHGGVVHFSAHARRRMEEHGLRDEDCERVLQSGWALPAEWEHGTWRYRLRTQDVTIVVTFRSIGELVVVTVWRN